MNNYVKLKEMELQRKINELNEQVNYLNVQNAELEEASRKMANYVPNLKSYEETIHKVNFLKNSGSKPFLYSQTEPNEEDYNYMTLSNEKRINSKPHCYNMEEIEESERESSENETSNEHNYVHISERSNESGSMNKESKQGRSLIPHKSSSSGQSKPSNVSKKSCKNASLNDASNFLDENRDMNRSYNVKVASKTRSVQFAADNHNSADTANWG
jgi:hypothetical protein